MIQEREAIRLVDANIMGVLVSNLDGQIIEANDAFLDMLGYTRDDLAGGRLRWTELTPPEWQQPSLRAVAQMRATGRSEVYEVQYLRKDGSRVTVLVGGAALEGARGETVSFVLDLTERKRAEAVRRGEKELGAAIETIPAMVWSAWPDGHADFFNRRWQEYTGLSLEQSLGWDWGATVHPEDAEQYFAKWRECIATGQPIEVEVRLRRAADGEYLWFLDCGEPLRDEQGNVLKWYGVVTDIDDRKRAEAFLAGEKRILEMVARGDSLGRILESLCRLVEEQAPGVLASVLLVDGNRLRHGGAPSLPKAYTDAIDGGLIGPQAGSCGTAAYRAEQVIVSDIATDPLWADYRDAALPHGLRACWSTPIFSSEGKVIATFAMYYRNARSPGARDQQIIEQIGHLAGVAIQSKAAQEELKKRAALLNLAHDAIIVRDIESRIEFWNPGAEKTYGWTAQEAIGRVSHELLQTRFPVSREDVDFALQEKGEWEGELRHVTRHGTEIVVTSRQSQRRDEHGASATILEINRDLTERKKAEEAARRSEKELRGVVETVPGMVWSALPDGHVDFINRRWQEFTGLTLDETLGWSWEAEAPFHPDDFDAYMVKWQASLATGQPFEAEMRIRRAADGEYRWLFESAVPLRDEQGNILKWYGFVVDIEDRKRAEEALQKAQAELAHVNRVATMGQLTASIAHEVNQPITAAVTNAQVALGWLGAHPPDLEEVKEALDEIVKNGNRAADVIGRIRALINKAPPRKGRFDLNDAIRDVIPLTRSEVLRNGVLLQIDLATGLPSVKGDRVQLQQVILNLILNAVEAMSGIDEERKLLISTETDASGGVLVAVRDSGPGLDSDSADRLFEAFYTTKSSGMGMGLSICRSIVEAHGGRVWASANKPRGAVFQFTLPSEQDETVSVEPAATRLAV